MSGASRRRPAGRSREQGLGARLETVRRGIEHWRETREKRSRMPEPLWEAAVAAAREHGVWGVSRALGVNYQSLRTRVEGLARGERGGASTATGFVEIDGGQLLVAPEREGTTLELARPDGSRLTIRLEGRGDLDLPGIVEAFWRSGG